MMTLIISKSIHLFCTIITLKYAVLLLLRGNTFFLRYSCKNTLVMQVRGSDFTSRDIQERKGVHTLTSLI